MTISAATVAQLVISGVVVGCIYALVAVGFNIIFDSTGMINFAQGQFVILGGFVFYSATTALHLGVVPAVLVAVAAVALLGSAVQLGVLRLARGEGLIGRDGTTIGVALLIVSGASAIWGVDALRVAEFTPGPPLLSGTVAVSRQQVWIVVTTVLAAVSLQYFFHRTVTGIGIRAAAMNPQAARSVGLSVERIALVSWTLSALLSALAGVLITPVTGVSFAGGFSFTLSGFAAAILGGLGKMSGAILGGLVLGIVTSVSAAFIATGFQTAIPMLLLFLVFLLRPTGILGRARARV